MAREIIHMNLFTCLLLAGIIFGFIFGIILKRLKDEPYTSREIFYINFAGEIFLRMLKATLLPLIVSSLISAIGSIHLKESGTIGIRTLLYYFCTTFIAVLFGILWVVIFRPGVGLKMNNHDSFQIRKVTTIDTLLDLLRNIFPPNVVQVCLQQYQTTLTPPSDNMISDDIYTWEVSGEYIDGINMLGVVVCSIAVGITLSVEVEAKYLSKLIKEISQLSLKLIGWLTWLSPIGIMSLICAKVVATNNAKELLQQLGAYSGIVIFGVLFHGFIVIPTILFLFTRKNPYIYIGNMAEAMVIAFGTGSSASTLPATLACVENKNKVENFIARFILPIGATINMDGAALYEAVASIYIAQIRGLSLGFTDLLAISITATAASIGTAAIPQSALMTMVMVLTSIGLPAEDLALIIPADWFLDRFCTTVNILSDSVGAAIISHLHAKPLKRVLTDLSLKNVAGRIPIINK